MHLKLDPCTPSSTLGSALNENQENALKVGPKTTRLKRDPRQRAWNETQDNALEAKPRTMRLKQELELIGQSASLKQELELIGQSASLKLNSLP
jgi:hypothetical protein